MNVILIQLKLFYKSRSLLSGFLIKNKYVILMILIFTLISMIFHKCIVYFKDINIYDNYALLILICIVLIYFTYIKFNLMIRIIYLGKSISFFYYSIKQKNINDIKTIAFYYYFFNLLLILFSIIFLNKIHSNFVSLNLISLIDYTNIISILFVLFSLSTIFTTEFKIVDNDNFNPLKVLYYIAIIFMPLLIFNCFYELIMDFFEKYFLNYFVVHCDTIGDMKFNEKLKENNSVVTLHSSNSFIRYEPNINNNTNLYLKTPSVESSIASSSSVKMEDTVNNLPPLKLEKINDYRNINKKILHKFIVDYFEFPFMEFDDNYYTKAIDKKNTLFEIDPSLLKSINFYADLFHLHKVPSRHFLDFTANLNIYEKEYNEKSVAIFNDFVNKKDELYILKDKQELIISKALEEYHRFRDHDFPEKYEEIKSNYETKSKKLDSEKDDYFYKEIAKFKKSASKLKKFFKQKEADNSSSDEEELFYVSKRKNNSTTTIDSVDSDETIKPLKRFDD